MGIITDFIAILAGSIFGLIIGNKVKESMRNIIMDSIGLFIIISGVKSTLESNRDITVLVYLIAGAIIGQIVDIDLQIKKLSIFI